MEELLFSEYERAWVNFDTCMRGFKDILVFCRDSQPSNELIMIGNIIERTLKNINRVNKEEKPKPPKQENWHLRIRDYSKHDLVSVIETIFTNHSLNVSDIEEILRNVENRC
jgi:hypothetical protein